MTSAAAAVARLHALATRLETYNDLDVECVDGTLRVRSVAANGCCPDSPRRADRITCRTRPGDANRLWYFTSWRNPIAEADRVIDAAVRIHGYIAGGH